MRTNPKAKRGSALLVTLFFLILLTLVGFAFVRLLPVELHAALKEKQMIQGGYAADAALVTFAQYMKDNGGQPLAAGTTGTLAGTDWTWSIVSVDTSLGSDIYRVTTEGQQNGRAHRRVVAIVAWASTFSPINYAFFHDGAGAMNNKNAFWPGNVDIHGDIFFDGIWSMDTDGINVVSGDPNDAPVQGNVYFTDQATSGSGQIKLGVKGEQYVGDAPAGGNPVAEIGNRYDNIYRDGSDALIPFPNPGDLDEVTIHGEVIDDVLAGGLESSVPSAAGVYLTNNGSQATGGIYVQGSVDDMEWTQDSSGNSVVHIELSNGDNWTVTYAGGSISVTDHDGSGTTETFPADGSQGNNVVFVNGDLNGVHTDKGADGRYGTGDERGFKGQHTLAVNGNVRVTGEILKDQNRFPRPTDPNAPTPPQDPNSDILGIIAGVSPTPLTGNQGTLTVDISVPNNQRTPDHKYYIYAPLMGLNKKMFSNPTHPSVPNNGKLMMVGQLVFGGSNQGQLNTATGFIEAAFEGIWLDPNNNLLPYWPTLGGANGEVELRSYVEGSAAELQ